jgi:hypothetical protein
MTKLLPCAYSVVPRPEPQKGRQPLQSLIPDIGKNLIPSKVPSFKNNVPIRFTVSILTQSLPLFSPHEKRKSEFESQRPAPLLPKIQ